MSAYNKRKITNGFRKRSKFRKVKYGPTSKKYLSEKNSGIPYERSTVLKDRFKYTSRRHPKIGIRQNGIQSNLTNEDSELTSHGRPMAINFEEPSNVSTYPKPSAKPPARGRSLSKRRRKRKRRRSKKRGKGRKRRRSKRRGIGRNEL